MKKISMFAVIAVVLFSSSSFATDWLIFKDRAHWGQMLTIKISPDMQKRFNINDIRSISSTFATQVNFYFVTREGLPYGASNEEVVAARQDIESLRRCIKFAAYDENGKKWVAGTKEAKSTFKKSVDFPPGYFTIGLPDGTFVRRVNAEVYMFQNRTIKTLKVWWDDKPATK